MKRGQPLCLYMVELPSFTNIIEILWTLLKFELEKYLTQIFPEIQYNWFSPANLIQNYQQPE